MTFAPIPKTEKKGGDQKKRPKQCSKILTSSPLRKEFEEAEEKRK